MGGKRCNSKRSRSKSGSSPTNRSSFRRRSPIVEHDPRETGYTVDTADLLFKPGRDYLVKNNDQKVRVDELKGKSIVLFIFPLGRMFTARGEALDMVDAYNELLPLGGVEFVFVPVHHPCDGSCDVSCDGDCSYRSQEYLFLRLFYSMPFPAVPLSDIEAWDGPVMKTFGLDESISGDLPYWVLIDPSSTVVFTRSQFRDLFKLFGGAELYPLSHKSIWSVIEQYWTLSERDLINKWDQLLASPDRDYLLSVNGNDRVPISSLKGKVVGLYFCDNVAYPPSLHSIKRVYEEAKLRGLDFEIVQINLPWPSFRKRYPSANLTLVQRPEGIRWLTLPFKDPSWRKLLDIFPSDVFDDDEATWDGDSLVIIDARQAAAGTDVPCEFSGAEILRRWGIKGYPFTRPSLFRIEYEIQKREVTLQSLFPPGECLRQPSGELVDASKLLSGKKVLVFFNDHTEGKLDEGKFVTMLLSRYRSQRDRAEEDKFEVVYVSTHFPGPSSFHDQETASELSYQDFMRPMPWLAHPSPRGYHYLSKVFKAAYLRFPAAAAFGSQGELIAKAHSLDQTRGKRQTRGKQHRFPFISTDLESFIQREVNDSGLLGLE